MEWTPILIGIVAGGIVSYLIFYFAHKANSVPKTDFDAQATKLQDAHTQLKLTEDRLKSHQELAQTLQQKADMKESELSTLLSRTATLEAQLSMNGERLQDLAKNLNEQADTNRSQQSELNLHQKQVAELRALNSGLSERLESQKTEMIEIQKTAHLQFEKIAQQIFEEKSGKFTETNKFNIDAILKPLSENIESFKKKVEETYEKDSKDRILLHERVKDLQENTNRVSQEANNLATALKGQAKKQGDWGETILERILEMSGLEKGREYYVQENLKDEEGNNLRPDIIVRLPENRNIVIDSKVSLNAYLKYTESELKEEQDIFTAQHITAVTNHINDLSGKKYHELVDSLNFQILFIPIEPAYMLALQSDPNLSAYAYAKGIMVVSPHTLLGVLQIVADLWKREMQNKNALAIASEGGRLFEKFIVFLETLDELGKNITKSQTSYTKAIMQLKDGKGNLIGRAEKLKELGVKSAKKIPPSFQSLDPDEEEPLRLPHTDDAESEI